MLCCPDTPGLANMIAGQHARGEQAAIRAILRQKRGAIIPDKILVMGASVAGNACASWRGRHGRAATGQGVLHNVAAIDAAYGTRLPATTQARLLWPTSMMVQLPARERAR